MRFTLGFRLWVSALTSTLAFSLGTATALAQASVDPDYSTHPKALELAEKLYLEHRIPQSHTLELLSEAKKLNRVIEAVKPPKTKGVRNWDTYRSRFVEPFRIEKGVEFWADNEKDLQEASRQFGIPPEVIVAIIGVETLYGRHIGKDRVLDSLATLSFDYPSGQKDRSGFFLSELGAFIVLCNTSHLDAREVKGSYAGAIGLGQFMPSSWQAYAVDGDQDGIVDLFGSRRDAIFSVANFLKQHGWAEGHATLVPVEIKDTTHFETLLAPDIVPTFKPRDLIDMGLKLKAQTLQEEKLALIELVRGENNPVYVAGGQNFYVVTRYNRSSFYATAVLELSEAVLRNRELSIASRNRCSGGKDTC